MEEKYENNLSLGIDVKPIAEQLKADGLECNNVAHFQEIADAISTLQKTEYISNSLAGMLRDKLFKQMYPCIKHANK